MFNKKTTILIFIGISLLIIGISRLSRDITGYVVMNQNEVVLIDVRTFEEHAYIRIPDSILIPYDTIMFNIEEVVPNKDTEIIVYCRSGRRSSIAEEILRSMGYTNVKDIGGIIDWIGPTTGDIYESDAN